MMSATMKAIQLQAPGGPEVLQLVELPLPQPQAGEVRVKAMAIGAGGPDVLIRNGTYKWMPPCPRFRATSWPAWSMRSGRA